MLTRPSDRRFLSFLSFLTHAAIANAAGGGGGDAIELLNTPAVAVSSPKILSASPHCFLANFFLRENPTPGQEEVFRLKCDIPIATPRTYSLVYVHYSLTLPHPWLGV